MATSKFVKCIVVLIGIPGCGKSTLASLMYDKLGHLLIEGDTEITYQSDLIPVITKRDLGVIVISYDVLIPENITLDDLSKQTWKLYREEIVLCIETLLNISSFSLDAMTKPSSGVDDSLWEKFYDLLRKQSTSAETVALVIDDNMYYTSMRHRYFQLARKYTCGFCQLFLPCDVEVALHRNRQREQRVKDDVIVKMAVKIEPPNKHDNSWETNSIVINSQIDFESQLRNISKLVMTAIKNPVQPLEEVDPADIAESRQICSSNAIHQSDQILRKIVSQKMTELKAMSLDKPALQQLSKQYLDVRKSCLEKIKDGHVTFPVTVDPPGMNGDKNSELYQQIIRLFDQLLKDVT